MAKPRVFVSSTFYDLKYIRADLERFIHSMGYEPILNESGHIPYGSQEGLEHYCYKEIELCDILVGIIGGRFGTESENDGNSITQMEIKTALKNDKQVYIFIEKNVDAQYNTYQANKENKEIVEQIIYANVDNIKTFEYIEEIKSLARNNIIFHFDNVEEICCILKIQWAGLFKGFLQNQAKEKFTNTLDEIKRTASTLQNLVDYLSEKNAESAEALKDILLSSHPAMEKLREILSYKGKIYFSNSDEMEEWLLDSGFKLSLDKNDLRMAFNEIKEQGITLSEMKNYRIFELRSIRNIEFLYINYSIFDNGKLRPCSFENWDDTNIMFYSLMEDEFYPASLIKKNFEKDDPFMTIDKSYLPVLDE